MQVETHWLKPQGPERRAQQEPALLRWTLIVAALTVIVVLIIVPVASVFTLAFGDGIGGYWRYLTADPHTRQAMLLTLFVAPIAVAANVVFGVAAAWAIARFHFPGRTLLTTLIDLPFAISPVVVGLTFMLLFGRSGYFGPWLLAHGIKIVFAWPGIVLATTFVTLPFVAREVLPVMEAIGSDEEIAAVSLGASGWQMFWRVTVPNIKWGLLYGVTLCSARAIGEYGAVHVVSGHIAGKTDTVPLRIEKLFQAYPNTGSYALASVLTFLALVTLGVKTLIEHKTRQQIESVGTTGQKTEVSA
jgi:sulfate transport system permease protein